MERILLVGSEEVSRATSLFRSAVDDFGRHVAYLGAEQRQHQQFLDDWSLRLRDMLEALPEEVDRG